MLPDVPVHIVHRGNNRGACFFSDQDRAFYLSHLGRLLSQCGCMLHAYCLMTNHVHLLLTPSVVDGCAKLMKRLALVQTQYANRSYCRTGTLWEGRFRSCLIQKEHYLLNCYRYIELNPVRAGLTDQPGDFYWSSYLANAEGVKSPLLTAHAEYVSLGDDAKRRQESYRALFGLSQDFDPIRRATDGNLALGDKPFRNKVAAALGRRVEPGKAGRPRDTASNRHTKADLFRSAKTWSVPD